MLPVKSQVARLKPCQKLVGNYSQFESQTDGFADNATLNGYVVNFPEEIVRLPRTHQSLTTLASSPTWGISQESATREPALILAIDSYMSSLPQHRRIRLVAYGARLESVLGESPRGFESPILRSVMSRTIGDIWVGTEIVFLAKAFNSKCSLCEYPGGITEPRKHMMTALNFLNRREIKGSCETGTRLTERSQLTATPRGCSGACHQSLDVPSTAPLHLLT